MGFTFNDKAFPRQGYPIHFRGAKIGDVTSGTFSPILDRAIGMGYVDVAHAKTGTAIGVVIRNKEIPATVSPIPFIAKK